MNRVLLLEVFQGKLALILKRILRRNFPIPLLVVADIATEIADGRVRGRNRFDLLGRYDEQVVLWAFVIAFITRRCA